MRSQDLTQDVIRQILQAIGRIERRAKGISTPDDFIKDDEGLDKLDAIAMMLIAIGESCKYLDKLTEGGLLPLYPAIDWKGVKGIRDILSHQYFDIDAELIFSVCGKHIPLLKKVFIAMLSGMSDNDDGINHKLRFNKEE